MGVLVLVLLTGCAVNRANCACPAGPPPACEVTGI